MNDRNEGGREMKRLFLGMVFLSVLLVLGACGDRSNEGASTNKNETENNGAENSGSDDKPNEEKEDVTLLFYASAAIGDFEGYWKPLIEEKLPHITVEYMEGNMAHANHVEELIAGGVVPDIVFGSTSESALTLKQFELGYDLTELIEKNDFDLSRFNQEHLDNWTAWSDGEIWFLPFMKDIFALHYNKDVFDLFGVPYPTDDMTWEEVIELSKKVTGERNGVQYRGLHVADMGLTALSQVTGDLNLIDPETEEVLWTEDQRLVKLLDMVEEVHTIPGNEFPNVPSEISPFGAFLEGTLAMLPRWFVFPTEEDGINWDIVTFPQWEENLGVGPAAEGWALAITDTSEHKEEAFEVLELLYSDEHIMDLASTPLHVPYDHLLESGAALEHLNEEDHGHFMDKNLEALSKLTSASAPAKRSEYDIGAFQTISKIAYAYLDSGKDMNTFLREIREQEEVRVKEETGKN